MTAPAFWSRVNKTQTCWLWTGSWKGKGYGSCYIGGRHRRAHRVAYELANGPIPAGLQVCHRCDVRLCVRPDHLFLGTASDNQLDAARKGRNPMQLYPERHRRLGYRATHCVHGHPLTPENVYEYPRANGRPSKRTCKRCSSDQGKRRHAERLARETAT